MDIRLSRNHPRRRRTAALLGLSLAVAGAGTVAGYGVVTAREQADLWRRQGAEAEKPGVIAITPCPDGLIPAGSFTFGETVHAGRRHFMATVSEGMASVCQQVSTETVTAGHHVQPIRPCPPTVPTRPPLLFTVDGQAYVVALTLLDNAVVCREDR
jgi:hypothetical protein